MVNPSQDLADAMFAKMDELAEEFFQREVLYGNGTGEPRGILNMPGVATLVDDGVTRGPMRPLMARVITVEDAIRQISTSNASRPVTLLPESAVTRA